MKIYDHKGLTHTDRLIADIKKLKARIAELEVENAKLKEDLQDMIEEQAGIDI